MCIITFIVLVGSNWLITEYRIQGEGRVFIFDMNFLYENIYYTFQVLYWCLTVLCMLNFLVMFYRYVMGIDFQVNFGDDNKDLKKAGPSDYNK